MDLNYPLQLKFRLIALAPRIKVFDATGQEVLYVQQKVLAIKEAVSIFNNSQEKKLLYTINANQILDFGASYTFRSAPSKKILGSVQQEGMRSLYRATYTVFDAEEKPLFKIQQARPWAAVLDAMLSIIPFVEFVSGYILNPTYLVHDISRNETVVKMRKLPSFFESSFEIAPLHSSLSEKEELLILLSLLIIVQLEQKRS